MILNRDIQDLEMDKFVPVGDETVVRVSGSSAPYAIKITEVGSVLYVAKAPVGTAQASAAWQAMKIDKTTGLIVTWADGNSLFDNVATDLTALAYS